MRNTLSGMRLGVNGERSGVIELLYHRIQEVKSEVLRTKDVCTYSTLRTMSHDYNKSHEQ